MDKVSSPSFRASFLPPARDLAQLEKRSIRHPSFGRSLDRSVGGTVGRLVGRSVRLSVGGSVARPADRSRSDGRSVDR